MTENRLASRWFVYAGLVGIVLATIAVRWVGLLDRSLWFDEAMSWRTARLPWSSMMASIRLNTHAPLFFVVLKLWMIVWGESLVSLRGLNLMVAVVVLPMIVGFFRAGASCPLNRTAAGLMSDASVEWGSGRSLADAVGCDGKGRSLADAAGCDGEGRSLADAAGCDGEGVVESGNAVFERAAWMAMVLFAISPLQIRVASEVRMYPLMGLMTLGASWAVMRVLACPGSWPRWLVLAMAMLATLYVHYFGLFLVAGQFVFLGCWVLIRDRRRWRTRSAQRVDSALSRVRSRTWKGMLILVVSVGLGWSLWLPTFWEQRGRVDGGWWTDALSVDDLNRLSMDWVMTERLGEPNWNGFTIAIGLIIAVVVGRLFWMRHAVTNYLAIMIVLPILLAIGTSLTGSNLIIARYFAPIHLLWLMGLATVMASVRGATRRHGLFAFVVLFSVVVHGLDLRRQNPWDRHGIRDAVAWVENRVDDDDLIVVDSSLIYFPASYYATDRPRWKLLESCNGVSFSTGLPVLRLADRIEAEEIRELGFDRIDGIVFDTGGLDTVGRGDLWVVSTGSQKMYVPDQDWQPIGREFFDGTMPFQETVMVTRYRHHVAGGLP